MDIKLLQQPLQRDLQQQVQQQQQQQQQEKGRVCLLLLLRVAVYVELY